MEDLRGHGAYSSLPGTMQTNKEFPSTEYNEILETRHLFLAPMQKRKTPFTARAEQDHILAEENCRSKQHEVS